MRRIIREAQPSDMAEIMQVMDAAKIIMRQSGNMAIPQRQLLLLIWNGMAVLSLRMKAAL